MGICFHYLSVPPHVLAQCAEDARFSPDTLLFDERGEERVLESGWQHLDVDKAWDGIWYLLSAERRATDDIYSPSDLLGQAVDGFDFLRDEFAEQGYQGTRFLSVEKVREVIAALKGIGPSTLWEHFDPVAMEEADVYPGGWDESRWDYLLSYFNKLKGFYEQAAASNHAVIVWGG